MGRETTNASLELVLPGEAPGSDLLVPVDGNCSRPIRTGDLAMFRGTMPHSRIIEGWTHGVYSHAACFWWLWTEDMDARLVIIEAVESLTGGRVRVRPADVYLRECAAEGCRVDVFRVRGSQQQRQRIAAYCLRQWDKRYVSPWQMLWSFVRLNKWVRTRFGLPANLNPERWFCSELLTAAAASAGLVNPEDVDPVVTDPNKLARLPCVEYYAELRPVVYAWTEQPGP